MERTFKISEDFPPVAREAWRELVERELKGRPFEKLATQTYEGVEVQPLYTQEDEPETPRSAGGRRGPWEVRQECAHPAVEAANAEILTDLGGGCDGVELRLDRAARVGLSAEDAEGVKLAGHDGLAAYTARDLATALEGVRPDAAGIYLEAGASFLSSAALLAAALEKLEGGAKARGGFNADPLGGLATDGMVSGTIFRALGEMAELAVWTDAHLPHFTSVRVCTAAYHRAGATAVQDLAISMATGVLYLRAMTEAGMNVGAALGQMSFTYSVGVNFFLATAKLRAARRLWCRIGEAVGAPEHAQEMRVHARSARRVMTERDPWVNILRGTACCFAGAVGGADAITVDPFDVTLGLPGERSRRLARNTQIILQEESHLSRVADPGAGSWYVEKLTDELAERAWALFQEIEGRGGMAAVMADGWIAEQIDQAYAPREKNVSRRKDALTGVSEFPNLAEKVEPGQTVDVAAVVKAAQERLAGRGGAAERGRALKAIEQAKVKGLRMAAAVAAAEAGATVSELAKALGGGATEVLKPLPLHSYGEAFERLRRAADEAERATGQRPKVFLASLGPVAQHTARSTFARNFFEAGGFEVVTSEGYADGAEAAGALKGSGAGVAVICSSDKLYEEMAVDAARELKGAGAETVVLAGRPGEREAAWREAGVEEFIYIGCDVARTLQSLLHKEGVKA